MLVFPAAASVTVCRVLRERERERAVLGGVRWTFFGVRNQTGGGKRVCERLAASVATSFLRGCTMYTTVLDLLRKVPANELRPEIGLERRPTEQATGDQRHHKQEAIGLRAEARR